MSNIKWNYFCIDENKWIEEIRLATSVPPTKCKNHVDHVVKADSVYVNRNGYLPCAVKRITGNTNAAAIIDTSTITLQQLAERFKLLEDCAIEKSLLTEL